jgi:hypothetical protein
MLAVNPEYIHPAWGTMTARPRKASNRSITSGCDSNTALKRSIIALISFGWAG